MEEAYVPVRLAIIPEHAIISSGAVPLPSAPTWNNVGITLDSNSRTITARARETDISRCLRCFNLKFIYPLNMRIV